MNYEAVEQLDKIQQWEKQSRASLAQPKVMGTSNNINSGDDQHLLEVQQGIGLCSLK